MLTPGELDSSTSEMLMQFAAAIRRKPIVCARSIFPDRPKGYVRATRELERYADIKAVAIEARVYGKIRIAVQAELDCESIYHRLPDYAKW